jgi:hypothetical protein
MLFKAEDARGPRITNPLRMAIQKGKAARRRLFEISASRFQAKRNAGLAALRRYAKKPMPKKPRIIMPQVAGSGTAETPAVPTAKPYQSSVNGVVQEIEVIDPLN